MLSPRYVGHMASDLLWPGLLTQLLSTLYNPDNVSADAAPATLDLEVQAGQPLARMCGFNTDRQHAAAQRRPSCRECDRTAAVDRAPRGPVHSMALDRTT